MKRTRKAQRTLTHFDVVEVGRVRLPDGPHKQALLEYLEAAVVHVEKFHLRNPHLPRLFTGQLVLRVYLQIPEFEVPVGPGEADLEL